MNPKLTRQVLIAFVLAHLGLALCLAWITPFRTAGMIGPSLQPDIGAPDERQQVNYVLGLANGGGFPVFNPTSSNFNETYESHQPPLFYLLDTAWGKLTGATLPPVPPASGPAMSQTDGFKLRSLNALFGAAGVVGVFLLVLWAFSKPEAALAAAIFAALLPMNAALSGAVSNDPLLISLCTWTLALTARGVRYGWSGRLAFGVGLLAGLTILTKTTGVVILPALLVAVAQPAVPRLTAKEWAAAALPILILVVPWWLRNQRLYGDPLAMGAFSKAFVGTTQASYFTDRIGAFAYWTQWVGWWTARSMIGVFGYMDIWMTSNGTPAGTASPDAAARIPANLIYLLAWLLIGVGFVGWLMSLRGSRKEGDDRMHWVNGVFFVAVLISFIRFDAQYFQAQGRYLLPALGPIAGGVGLGLTRLAKDRWKYALMSVILVLGIADVFAVNILPDAFAKRTPSAHAQG